MPKINGFHKGEKVETEVTNYEYRAIKYGAMRIEWDYPYPITYVTDAATMMRFHETEKRRKYLPPDLANLPLKPAKPKEADRNLPF